MKLSIVLLAVCCCLSAASGQWLERKIYMPDSAGGVLSPQTAASDPTGTRVYVGGITRGVSVLDAASGQRLYRIETGPDVSAVCHVPVRNKVYVATRDADTLYVADGSAGHVLSALRVGRRPAALACLPTGQRVYVACAGTSEEPDSTVYEIDCSADTVRAVHAAGHNPNALCYNPANNMLYSANTGSNTVSAIPCSSGTEVTQIPVGSEPVALACNPANNKVYCANAGDTTVSVIDGGNNQVEATVVTGQGPQALCYDSIMNTVFCANRDSRTVAVIDGAEDRVIATVYLSSRPWRLEFDIDSNRVYCLTDDSPGVATIDARSNRLVDSILLGEGLSAMCFARQARCVYVADPTLSAVAVIASDSSKLRRWTRLGIEPEMLLVNSSGTKLYAFGGVYAYDSVNVSAIDPQTCAVTKCFELPVSGHPSASSYNSADSKFYYVGNNDHNVAVIDAQRDSVRAYVSVPDSPYGLAYAADVDKVYVGGGYFDGYVDAIDGRGDTLVASVSIPGGGGVYDVCYNSAHGTVYGFGSQRAVFTVIDCLADTVAGQFSGEAFSGASLCDPISDKVYMVGDISGAMLVIDGATNAVLARIDNGSGPDEICLDTADNKVYCSSLSAGSLNAVDVAGDSLIARLFFHDYTRYTAYDPDHNVIYCDHDSGNTNVVSLVDGAADSIVGRILLDGYLTEMTAVPQADRVFVADAGNSCLYVIRTSQEAVTERPSSRVSRVPSEVTILRGVLFMPEARGEKREARGELLDISGRKVLDLRPGANDVRALTPGVYFVREAQAQAQAQVHAVRKVVVTR